MSIINYNPLKHVYLSVSPLYAYRSRRLFFRGSISSSKAAFLLRDRVTRHGIIGGEILDKGSGESRLIPARVILGDWMVGNWGGGRINGEMGSDLMAGVETEGTGVGGGGSERGADGAGMRDETSGRGLQRSGQ